MVIARSVHLRGPVFDVFLTQESINTVLWTFRPKKTSCKYRIHQGGGGGEGGSGVRILMGGERITTIS